jgi:DNA-binding XRE family transcriptional regulator
MNVLSSKEIAAFVRETRELAELDQESLAMVLRVSRRTIVRWEAGDATPRLRSIAGLVIEMFPHAPERARERAKQFGVEEVVAQFLPKPGAKPYAAHATAAAPPERVWDRALLLACDAADVPPRKMRAALGAALSELRAHAVSLDAACAAFTAKASA